MMSIIFLTGMLIYEGYRLWLWSNLAPIPPFLPSPVPDLDETDIKTGAATFETNKHFDENGFTLAPDIDYRTTTLNELPTVQFVTNTNNLFTQAKYGKTTATGLEPKIESVSDQFERKNSSKLSDLLLLLRLYPNTTHKVNIYIKKKNKETNGKPTAFDIIFNALNSKPQSLTSDLSHVMNSIKPTHSEIPKYYSTVINAETTTLQDQLKQISQLAVRKIKTTTALEITPNPANEDTLQIMKMLNDPRKSERSLTQDLNYLIPNTNSQLTVHEIEARIKNKEIETNSKETYRLPTPLANNKDTKSNQDTKTTLFKKLKRNCRSNKHHALHKLERRKMRHSRLYYTKPNKATEPNTMEMQIVNTNIESSTPRKMVKKSNRTTYSLKTTLEIDDDDDEFFDETEVYTQFESQGTTSSPKTLDMKYEFNPPIENEEDESESVEETEEPTKSNKNKTYAYIKPKSIEIPKNVDEITINDEEDETESGEGTEVSPATNAFIQNKNKIKTLLRTKISILKKHLDRDLSYDNIRYKKNDRKARTSKPFYTLNSTENDVKETNYIEDESDSAETTSVTTTIGDDLEELPREGMDILFILKTRLDKPTAATTSFDSEDLLQILVQNSTTNRFVDHDTNYFDSNMSKY